MFSDFYAEIINRELMTKNFGYLDIAKSLCIDFPQKFKAHNSSLKFVDE